MCRVLACVLHVCIHQQAAELADRWEMPAAEYQMSLSISLNSLSGDSANSFMGGVAGGAQKCCKAQALVYKFCCLR